MKLRIIGVAVCATLCSAPAMSQTEQPDPWEQARYRIGPFAFTPQVALLNLGVDTNVFNQPADPKRDFTFTLAPQVDWWLRAGPIRLLGTTSVPYTFFYEYETERAFNQNHSVTVESTSYRIRPYVGGTYLDAKERPGYEIDKRARRTETGANGGVMIRFSAKSTLDLAGSYNEIKFDAGDAYDGTALYETLNRRATSFGGTFRYDLTSLTGLSVAVQRGQERFVYSAIRDADSLSVIPGVEFQPFALVSGTARVGYRQVRFVAGEIPDFSGLVASLNLGYVLRGVTRFGVGFKRDLVYSYNISWPYYVLNDVNASVTQSVGGPWDITVRGSRQKLAYASPVSVDPSLSGRVDHLESWGGGVGYHLGRTARVGINVDYYRRRTAGYTTPYDGLRAGVSVTYGQ